MKPLKNRFSITLDEGVAEKVKSLAEEDDRSFSSFINTVLKNYIAQHEKASTDLNKQKTSL